MSSTLMIVRLRIAPAQEAEFNSFYHHRYIPRLLERVPELVSARRYEEHGVTGSLRWFCRQFWTIYETGSDQAIDAIEQGLVRFGRDPERQELERWRQTHLQDVERTFYREIYGHERRPADGPFGSRPCFVVAVEVKPEKVTEFHAWYQGDYLPRIMADVPTWAACRRYASVNRNPVRYLTVYEVNSLADLEESFALMRQPYRHASNADWDRWVGPAITWQDAVSLRPIFRRPG